MNWEAIAAIGESVGAAAVVLSLVYVAAQVRQNTKALRRSSSADAVAAVRDWNRELAVDPELNRIYRAGTEDFDSLSPRDRAQFGVIAFNLFKTFEDLHYQYVHGAMDTGVWTGWENIAKVALTGAGCRRYYEERRSYFSPEFRTWMDDQAPHEADRRLRDLTNPAEVDGLPPAP